MTFLTEARSRATEAMKRRPARWGAGIAAATALYAAAGFWLLPAVVPGILAGQLAKQGGRELSIAEFRFNPFTLRLRADDVRLRDRDGSELLALGALEVEAQWRSVLRRAWSFAEVKLVRPAAWVRVAPDGELNLARLVADFASTEPKDPDAPLPRVVIGHFEVADGRVEFDDRHAGYRTVVHPVAFDLQHFSTLPEQDQDHVFSARSETGGVLRWKGKASLQPLQATGEVTLDNVSLPELAVYLKPWTHATLAAGRLDASIPYTFSYADGKVQARVQGARTQLRQLAVAQQGAKDHFAALDALALTGIDADYGQLLVTVAEVKAEGGRLALRRDARGGLDLQALMVQQAGPAAAAPAEPAATATVPAAWRLELPKVALERMALHATDEMVSPALVLQAPEVSLRFAAVASQDAKGLQATVSNAELDLARLSVASGNREPLKLAQATVTGGSLDLAARKVHIEKVVLDGAAVALRRGADGQLDVAAMLPASAEQPKAPAASSGPQWAVSTGEIALRRSGVQLADAGSGVELQAQDIAIAVQGAGSDLAQSLRFQGELALRSGGRIAAKGQLVPATAALQADVQVKDIALAPVQPLLSQHLHLTLAGGSVSASGRVLGHAAPERGRRSAPDWQYDGAFHIRGLALKEKNGEPFASWTHLGADRLRATAGPNRLDIPELRLDGAQAKLIIEDDRSLNAARLLVRPPAPAAPASASGAASAPVAVAAAAPAKAAPATADATAAEAFPVRIRRVRLQDAKLDFTDLSLRPQFAAKIYELSGAVNGLSTEPGTRSQIELDGRVDDFGLARVRGELNAFSPRDSTDIQLVFRNVDMVPASPYSMKFAGYRIAQGRISLDLDYKIKDGRLDGNNRIVFDKLTLGERVDSPDAMKIPLQLALAILTDSDGRIDLGLPVSGSLDDPEFSYGALIWKAIGNLLGKIVTAPFRALGAALGGGGEGLEAIVFDPGSARLLPPEREKLKQVAGILAKRDQLKLAVPGHFSEAADGAALRRRALRLEVARRAGVPVAEGEEPGPLDAADRAVRVALRELYTQRFGKDALDKERTAAEEAARAPAAGASAPATVPAWRRVGNWVQGEPQVADGGRFYGALQRRLEEAQEVPAGAVQKLGEQRAAAIVEALVTGGVAADRAQAGPATAGEGDAKAVRVKLELAAR